MLLGGIVYFCIGSVVAQAIVLGVFWTKSAFEGDKRMKILAVLYDVDVDAMQLELDQADQTQPIDLENESTATRKNAALFAREDSFKNSLNDLVALQNKIRNEQERHEILTQDFDNLLGQMEIEAMENNLVEIRRTLEIMKSKQAKTQISRMLDDGAIEDVAKVIGAMPLASRGKILREFKTREEERQRHQIIQELGRQAALPDAVAGGTP